MDCIIFDCDGVLIDSEAVVLDVLADRFAARVSAGEAVRTDIAGLLGLPLEAIAREIGQRHGVTFDDVWVHSANREVELALHELDRAIPDVAWALGRIELPKAVVSNSRLDRVHGALQRTGLARYFGEAVFAAELVAAPKPAPDVYRHAAARLGYDPARCIAVEDSRAGVTAAVAAGLTVIGFTGGGHIPAGHADTQQRIGAVTSIASMRELPETLARLTEN